MAKSCATEQNAFDDTTVNIKQDLSDTISIKEELTLCTEVIIKEEPESDCSLDDEKKNKQSLDFEITQKGRSEKVLESQSRELIALVHQHMVKEAVHGVENLTDARRRTAQATGVSEKTVSRILKEKRKADETGSPMRSPHRNKKPRKCLRRDMEMYGDIIRDTVKNYYSEFKKPPTLHGIKSVLKERIDFNGCVETLRRVLKSLGYVFKATSSNSICYKYK